MAPADYLKNIYSTVTDAPPEGKNIYLIVDNACAGSIANIYSSIAFPLADAQQITVILNTMAPADCLKNIYSTVTDAPPDPLQIFIHPLNFFWWMHSK
jgi:hypothetical protein